MKRGWYKRMQAWMYLGLMLSFSTQVTAEPLPYTVEEVASGLEIPWGVAFVNPNTVLITERSGTAKLLSIESRTIQPLTGFPEVYAEGQGGLLDVAIPPPGEVDGWLYFTYSKPINSAAATTLARAQLEGSQLVDWQDLLVTQSVTNTSYHFGSRIAFDGAGHLFFTVGDRGVRPNGQDTSNHAATVLRLNLDGSVPKDNPFVGGTEALPEIWSYGHRNPQGIALDQQNRLWAIEHGPRGGDELNQLLPGRNYGWPVISYGKEYWGPIAVGEGTHREGMEQPVKYYVPSIAPGSLIAYSGKAFPQWKGDLFAGALKLRHINRIGVNGAGEAVEEERLLTELDERIRALVESPEGWIYFTIDSGKVFRVRPETD